MRSARAGNFLERCGAKATSKDGHWPMPLSIRAPTVAPDGAQLRGSGLRQRSAKAAAARKAKNTEALRHDPRPLQRLRRDGRSSGCRNDDGRSSGLGLRRLGLRRLGLRRLGLGLRR